LPPYSVTQDLAQVARFMQGGESVQTGRRTASGVHDDV
jgi:hypothetical protein